MDDATRREIQAVVEELDLQETAMRGGAAPQVHMITSCIYRLRALLPAPESLEEAAEKMLGRVNASVGCERSAVPLQDLRDLRAALARRRGEG